MRWISSRVVIHLLSCQYPTHFPSIEGLSLGLVNILCFQLALNSVLTCCGAEASIFMFTIKWD